MSDPLPITADVDPMAGQDRPDRTLVKGTGFLPDVAMVLAAGRGKRMRPLTALVPKPLVEVAGRPLIDHVLDRITALGVPRAIVNVHYMADLMEAHLRRRSDIDITISDERGLLLDTGGGTSRALPLLGDKPFLLMNSDTLWHESITPPLSRLVASWDAERMDVLLLVAAAADTVAYQGRGDFAMDVEGRLTRRPERGVVPFIYAGAAILNPNIFSDVPSGAYSLNLLFDRAAQAKRLYAVRLEGVWMHVGTPAAVDAAEARLRDLRG